MSLYKRDSSQFYWCRFEIRGCEYRYSTGKIDRREAESEERRLRVEAEQNAPPVRRRGVGPLSDLAVEDIQRSIREGADATVNERTLTAHWTPLLHHFGQDRDVGSITVPDVEAYVLARRAWPDRNGKPRRIRGQTIRRELACLHRAFKIAKKKGWVSVVPDRDEWPKLKKDPPNAALRGKLRAPELLRKLLSEANDRRLHGTTDATVRDHLVFAIVTGLRWAEIQRVTADWIEDDPPLVRLPEADTKTGDPRYVGLPPEGAEAVARRRDVTVPGGLLFPHKSLGQWLRRWSAKNNVAPAVTLRDLRHTYSTLGLQHSGDAAAVQAAMGHRDLRTTQLYQSSTVARASAVGVAVAREVFGAREPGTPKPAHKEDEPEEPPVLPSARLAQLDRATVSEADDLAIFLANFTPAPPKTAQSNPDPFMLIPAHLVGTPAVRLVAVVEGWLELPCRGCGRTVEVHDRGGSLHCPMCGTGLDRGSAVIVA